MRVERDIMGGFAKGIAVLEAFDAERQRLSISEAAHISGLDRATARRCLLTLAELGYAAYDGKYFSLTPKVLRLGFGWLASSPLAVVLQPHLDELSRRVGESSSASVLDGTDIVYVARAAQKRVMSVNLMPGSRLPAYNSSMGRVLLASLPPAELRDRLAASDLKARTPLTITDPEQLLAEIAKVREEGFAVIDQELELGLCSIAVPVMEAEGKKVAAMNLGVSAAVWPASSLRDRFLAPLLETQDSVRRMLYRAPAA